MRSRSEEVVAGHQERQAPSSAGSSSRWLVWGSLPVPLALVAFLVSWGLDSGAARGSSSTFVAIHVVSLVAGLVVAHLAVEGFRMSGSLGGLLLGCGALVWSSSGAAVLVVGRGGPNRIATVFSLISLLSAACHLAGVVVSLKPRPAVEDRRWAAVVAYVVTVALIVGVVSIESAGVLPPFFAEGTGSTPIRQAVLLLAILTFAAAAGFLIAHRSSRTTAFGRWYALALVSVTIALLATLVQTRMSSPLAWLGRGLHVLAGFYLLAAAVAAVRDSLTVALFVDTALREAESRYRGLVDSAPDGIAVHQAGKIVYANRAAVHLYGGKSEDLLGREALSIVHPDDRAKAAAWMKSVIAGEKVNPDELRLIRIDGTVVHAEVSSTPLTFRGASAGQVIVRDVSERRQAEEVLRRSESRLGLLSRTAARLLAATEPHTVLPALCEEVMEHLDCQAFLQFTINPSTGRLELSASAGLPPQVVEALDPMDVERCSCLRFERHETFPEPVPLSCDGHAPCLRACGIQNCCCHRLMAQGRALGTLAFCRRTGRPFTRDEVEVMYLVAEQVATALQRVESRRALREANARLLEEDRRKTDFLALLSHELRNPLAPISNCLHILERVDPHSDAASRARKVISRQVDQLSHLVDDLLDVTRIARNKISLHLEPLDLNDVVHRAVEDNRFLFDRAGVVLEARLWPCPVCVTGDRTRLTQVVGNLLHNAAKFSREGGRTLVSLAVADGQASVVVEDDGAGMSPATLASLFQPFVQAEQTLARSKGGLGLGLSLVKSLLDMHGGHVRASSAGVGCGSQFVIELQLAPVAAPVVVAAAAVESTRRRILIIEDNVDSAESLRAVLEMNQHAVSVAYNGPDGLAQARLFRPEVVLCDIGLPGMDGYEVARAFRADQELRRTCLVALSGYAAPEDVERSSQAGFQHHLAKPPQIDRLAALLASA
jgi:two-component system CheB/CheR fusion protein